MNKLKEELNYYDYKNKSNLNDINNSEKIEINEIKKKLNEKMKLKESSKKSVGNKKKMGIITTPVSMNIRKNNIQYIRSQYWMNNWARWVSICKIKSINHFIASIVILVFKILFIS